MGLARAFLPYVSKVCLLLTRSLWSGGLPAQSTVRFFDVLCELLFDFPLPLGAGHFCY